MARALWKGAISFGLVHIPVELHSAVQEHDLDLTMLDRRDFAPIGFRRYNKNTGKEVAWDDIIKGYEYADGEYVVLSDEDLRQANVEATQTIDILAFVKAEEVPLTYFETPYYLEPGRGGDKVYALLRETLRKADKIGIATVVVRTRQHLCALLCMGEQLIMNTLRFPDEIRATDELKFPPASLKAAGISDKELQMAMSLVDGMTEAWKPEQYRDTYRSDVMALVKKKIKAKQTKSVAVAAPEKTPARADNVVDLVALLKQSLGGKAKPAAAAKTATKAKAPAKPAAKPVAKTASKPPAKRPARTTRKAA